MPIDPNILLQNRGTNADIGGAMDRGMRMGDMLRKRKEEDAIKGAYKAGVVTNPDGTQTIDSKRTMSELMKVNPERAQAFGAEMQAQNAAKQLREVDLISRAAGSVGDQGSYDQALSYLTKQGVDVSHMPKAYDPAIVRQAQMQAISAKDRFEIEQRNLDRKDARDERRYLADREYGLKGKELNAKIATGEYLPIDKKKSIEGLSSKNAGKIAIKNQIDSVVNGWDNLSEEQQVAMGGQLLKTLNSPEGADAIGAEEAKRLGSKLQFAMGNFFNSNPTQFGRDLPGFKEQAQNTAKFLGNAINANQSEIDRTMGRAPSQPSSQAPTQVAGQDREAVQWALQNPQDPRSANILKVNGVQTAVGKR